MYSFLIFIFWFLFYIFLLFLDSILKIYYKLNLIFFLYKYIKKSISNKKKLFLIYIHKKTK